MSGATVTPLPRLLGSPSDHDGVFGFAERRAAEHYGADSTTFLVNGSTGGNQVLIRALALDHPQAMVLMCRNVHHSVINACNMLGVDYAFIPAPDAYDPTFEALLPPTPAEVAAGLKAFPDATAVYITSPTYEGLVSKVDEIAAVVSGHGREVVLIVDEAWGAHLGSHPSLPVSAIRCGADACVQSMHKLGGGLQQTAVLHVAGDRLDPQVVDRAFREIATTSPSFSLLASIESSIATLAERGPELIGRALANVERLEAALADRLPELELFASDEQMAALRPRVAARDPLRITLGLSRYAISGYELARLLLQRSIVPEKNAINAITFLPAYQLPDGAPERLAGALAEILGDRVLAASERKPPGPNPFRMLEDAPVLPAWVVSRRAKRMGEDVPLSVAPGLVAGEQLEIFPPGIPIVTEGFRITAGALDYVERVVAGGGTIAGRAGMPRTVRVVPNHLTAVSADASAV